MSGEYTLCILFHIVLSYKISFPILSINITNIISLSALTQSKSVKIVLIRSVKRIFHNQCAFADLQWKHFYFSVPSYISLILTYESKIPL